MPGPKKKDRFRAPPWYIKQRRLLRLARRVAFKEKQKRDAQEKARRAGVLYARAPVLLKGC